MSLLAMGGGSTGSPQKVGGASAETERCAGEIARHFTAWAKALGNEPMTGLYVVQKHLRGKGLAHVADCKDLLLGTLQDCRRHEIEGAVGVKDAASLAGAVGAAEAASAAAKALYELRMSRVEAPPSLEAILGNRAEDAQFEDWYNTVFSELSTSDAAATEAETTEA